MRHISEICTVALLFAGIALLCLPACETRGDSSTQGDAAAARVYADFTNIAGRSRIDLARHSTYTDEYVVSRAQLFCDLLSDGNMTELTKEITFPPVVHWTETATDRSRLEAAILMSGPPTYCPTYTKQANQWLATYMR